MTHLNLCIYIYVYIKPHKLQTFQKLQELQTLQTYQTSQNHQTPHKLQRPQKPQNTQNLITSKPPNYQKPYAQTLSK